MKELQTLHTKPIWVAMRSTKVERSKIHGNWEQQKLRHTSIDANCMQRMLHVVDAPLSSVKTHSAVDLMLCRTTATLQLCQDPR